jgi:repressor LexA
MLSTREQDAYHFIRNYILQHGRGPLLTEIALGLGIQSKGVAHRYVQSLAEQGLIKLVPGRHRGILLAEDEPLKDAVLPLVGRIAAGYPIEAIPGEDHIDLAEFFMGPSRFVLRVQGDSMIDAGILDGDMVIVKSSQTAHDDDIIVALIDGNEATLKYYRNNGDGSVTLIPANASMTPMTYSAARVIIQGVVVGQMRSYL